jgi:hypothetical protein
MRAHVHLAFAFALLACGDRGVSELSIPPIPLKPSTAAVAAKRPAARSATAFRDGGIPLSDVEIDRAVDDVLAKLLGAANAHARAIDRTLIARARELFAARDRGLDEAWRALVDAIERWRRASPTDLSSAGALQGPAAALNTAFERLGLGYHVHASNTTDVASGRISGIVDVYAVARVDRLSANGTVRRVLELADRGPAAQAPPGGELDASLDDRREPQGLVYVDSVARAVRSWVSPIAIGPPTLATAYRPSLDRQGRDPRDVIGAAIRRELDAALGAPDDSAVDAWLERVRALAVASCARHEVQHVLDWMRTPEEIPQLEVVSALQRAGADVAWPFLEGELTAYVSQIANEPTIPRLMLAFQLVHALTEHPNNLSYIAVIMFEGIARHLGITELPAIVHDRQLDRDRMFQLAARVMETDGASIRTAAAALWRELYGNSVATISDIPD